MRLVFFGTGTFAVPALVRLHPHIILAVTQPDRPSGRGRHMQSSPVKERALDLGLHVRTPERARSPEFIEEVMALRPDALLVASYGQILSQHLLDTTLRGGINLHGSLLPKYRGAAPIQRAILADERETGVTLMQMDRGMDTGDIIAMRRVPIGADETYGEVQEVLAVLAADMAEVWMSRIVAGDYDREAQDGMMATVAPKVDKSEAELRVERSGPEEYNRFRAFTPSPGAFLRSVAGNVRISKARRGNATDLEPGVIASTADELELAFRDETMRLLEVQPEGKKRMSGRDFANGLRLRAGSRLINPL